ncbi:MAG: PH domain-containing protein [Bacteroidia bacterium]|nr:PH domain-containing protein [Bacteroidia bacterium]
MGTYVQSVISSGERVEYEARISIWSMLPYFIVGLLFLPMFGLGLVFWLAAFIRYKTTELAITNKKIIAKFGFIRRDTIELLLPKVESIQVKQSLLGRMLNYGSIIVSGAGNPQAPVPGIDDPIQFRRTFMEIQEQSTK